MGGRWSGGARLRASVRAARLSTFLIWQARSVLHARVSAAAADSDAYVAIGFRPVSRERVAPAVQALVGSGMQALFGMKGADIVVGSAAGVQTMYAEKFTGPPERKSYLNVSDASAAVADGRVSLAFTRPLVDGKAPPHATRPQHRTALGRLLPASSHPAARSLSLHRPSACSSSTSPS